MKVLDPDQVQDLDRALMSRDDYSIFHTPAWAKVLGRSYGYKSLYFVLAEKDRQLAVIPCTEVRSLLTGRRGVSLAFTDYCEPLVEDPEHFQMLLDKAIEYGRKAGWKYIELRGGQKFLKDEPTFATYVVHTLSLTHDERTLLSSFKSNTRQNISRAIDEGIETRFFTSLESVKQFYRLHCMTRKRQGLPPQPFSFFRNVHDHVLSQDHGFVILASHNNMNIAGAMYFHQGKRALYKYGASDKSYQHLRANNLVMWEAIKWYSLHGCASFCFGRTATENKGLRQFKNGWGTVEKELRYYRYDLKKDRFVDGTTDRTTVVSRIMQNFPVPVLKLIGQAAYRHVG